LGYLAGENGELRTNQRAELAMDTFRSLSRNDFGIVVSLAVGGSRSAQNLARAKLYANVALFTTAGNEVNLASRNGGLLEVYGQAPINFHT
jgi:hypothetical protein